MPRKAKQPAQRTCNHCGASFARTGRQRYCGPKCRGASYRVLHAHKVRARSIARKYTHLDTCSRCGSTFALERHHANYEQPRAIEGLCFECHRLTHRPPAGITGKDLQEIRIRARLTVSQFAACLGVCDYTLRRWEAGKTTVPESAMDKIRLFSEK